MAGDSTCDKPGPLGSGATVGGRLTRATCSYHIGHNGDCSWAYKVSTKSMFKFAGVINPSLFPLTSNSFEEVVSARLTYRHLRLRGWQQTFCNGNFDVLTEKELQRKHHSAFTMEEFPVCATCRYSYLRNLNISL